MEDADIPSTAPSTWQPITDKYQLAILGKLGEELCEGGSSIFRSIIQGLDEAEPRTGKINRIWLEDEIADIYALLGHAVERLELNKERISKRSFAKYDYKAMWFDTLRAS